MEHPAPPPDRLLDWLARAQGGDRAAAGHLLGHAYDRLRRLARRMLRGCPRVRRWEETDDLCQLASVRLLEALPDARPGSLARFFALAAFHTRQALIDLIRRYTGPHGLAAHHATDPAPPGAGRPAAPAHEPADDTWDPGRLAGWLAFHEQAAALPDPERQVFELRWYCGLAIAEVAAALQVSERTVKRHWQAARLRLHDALHGEPPNA